MTAGDLTRFLPKVKMLENGCWEWQAYRCKSGYGRFHCQGRAVDGAHRVAYEHWKGAIGAGLTIDHLCRNRACVNPAHLEAVTMSENLRRADSWVNRKRNQTHCWRGHPLEGDNLRLRVRGGGGLSRECKTCSRMMAALWWERNEERRRVYEERRAAKLRNRRTVELAA